MLVIQIVTTVYYKELWIYKEPYNHFPLNILQIEKLQITQNVPQRFTIMLDTLYVSIYFNAHL